MSSTSNSVIGALRANLSLDSAQFKAGADQAKKVLGSLQGNFDKFSDTAKKVGVGLAAIGASIGAITAKVGSDAKNIKQMSTALGMTQESYQVMSKGAAKFGIEQDKLNDIIKDSNEKLGEYLTTGGGGYKDFMDSVAKPLGVSAQDLWELAPEDRFVKMQSMMEQMNIPLEQQSFFWESIASDATYLIPLLGKSGAEIQKMRDFMEQTGQILSDKVIANLSTFQSNVGAIGGVMSGWGNIFVSQFAPQLEDVSGKILNFLQNSQAVRDAFATAGQAVGSVLQFISDNSETISSVLTTAFQAVGAVLSFVSDNFQIIASLAAGAAIAFGGFALASNAVAIATGAVNLALGAFKVALASTGIGLAAVALGAIVYATWQWVDSVGGLSNALSVVGTIWNGVKDSMSLGISAIGNLFSATFSAIKAAFYSLVGAVGSGFASMLSGIEGGLNKVIDAANALGANLSKVDIGADALARNAANFGADGAKAALEMGEAYKGAAANIKGATDALTNSWSEAQKKIDAYKAAADKATKDRAAKEAADKAAANNTQTTPVKPPAPLPPVNNTNTNSGGGGGSAASDKAKDQAKAYEDLRKRVDVLALSLGHAAIQEKILTERFNIGAAAAPELVEKLVRQEDALTRFKDALASVGQSFTDNFSRMLIEGASFKDALGGLLSDLASMLAKSALNSLWGNFLGPAIGGIFGGGLPGFAKGTNGSPAGLALVGERGPELVNLKAGTRVTPANKTAELLNGSGSFGVKIEIKLSEGIEANILEAARANSIQISKQAVNAYDKKALARGIKKYTQDPRRMG